MDDQDLDLRLNPDGAAVPPEPQRSPSGPKILAALLVLVVVVTGYFVFRSQRAAPPPGESPQVVAPAPEDATPIDSAAEQIALPPLDESDPMVRELVGQLSSNPTIAAWLATDNLIRTFVVVVVNIASDESPSGRVPVLRPRGPFLVEERGGDLYIDPRSYERYSALTVAASSVDPAGAARLYTILKPRIEDAYRELGYPDTPFDDTLRRAIVTLLETPVQDGPIRLHPAGAEAYQFANLALESLQPAQKQLLRFGPDNARVVQRSLRAIALALGIPPASLP